MFSGKQAIEKEDNGPLVPKESIDSAKLHTGK